MSSFNDFCADVGRFADRAAKKTSELAHTASLHLKLEGVKNRLAASFEKLGRLTYKQLETGETQAEKISAVISTIDALRKEEKELKGRIHAMKEEHSEEKSEDKTE